MTTPRPRFVLMSLACATLGGLLAATPAAATDSACKGQEEAKCATTEGCAWTKEYTRKDGKTVAGHCKKYSPPPGTAAAKDKAAAAAPTPAPAGPPEAKPAAPPATKGSGTGMTPPK